ncbi:MAG TPA: helix-turn-helix domain-containing protein [Cellvibrionaceae bacterium]
MRQQENATAIALGARGLINRQEAARQFQLVRHPPSAELAHWVAHYWQVSWDLRGQPDYIQQNLPHPSVHLTLHSDGFCGISGVMSKSFRYRLSGCGCVLGVKFHPAAFSAFYAESAHTLTDKRITLGELWGEDEVQLRKSIAGATPAENCIPELGALLSRRAGSLADAAKQVRECVQFIASEPELCSLQALAAREGVSVRSLQRLFRQYLGVSPKWVIDRYRMIEAVEAINAGGKVELTDLAYRLGYADQAHFSKAFTALVGVPPSRV